MRADAGTVVERIDFAQVEIGEFEVEYVDVLSDSSIVYGFRDDDQAVREGASGSGPARQSCCGGHRFE